MSMLLYSWSTFKTSSHKNFYGQAQGAGHSFLQDETWLLHGQVARLRRACARCRFHVRKHTLAAAFEAWKTATDFLSVFLSPWLQQAHRAQARLTHELDSKSRQLKQACIGDRTLYLENCARLADQGRDREA